MFTKWIKRLIEPDEITWDKPGPLVNQLIERVLPIGSRLAPVNRPGIVIDFLAGERHVLAVALHSQLLQIGRKALQILLVWQHRHRLRPEEVVVPDCQQSQQHRQVTFEWGRAEVLVHLMEAVEHGAKVIRAYGCHGRKADRRVHRVATAYTHLT